MTEAQLSNAMDAYGSTVYRLALTRMQNIADAVRTRLHRARKQLKELLGGIDDETCVSRSDGTNFGPQRAE